MHGCRPAGGRVVGSEGEGAGEEEGGKRRAGGSFGGLRAKAKMCRERRERRWESRLKIKRTLIGSSPQNQTSTTMCIS